MHTRGKEKLPWKNSRRISKKIPMQGHLNRPFRRRRPGNTYRLMTQLSAVRKYTSHNDDRLSLFYTWRIILRGGVESYVTWPTDRRVVSVIDINIYNSIVGRSVASLSSGPSLYFYHPFPSPNAPPPEWTARIARLDGKNDDVNPDQLPPAPRILLLW